MDFWKYMEVFDSVVYFLIYILEVGLYKEPCSCTFGKYTNNTNVTITHRKTWIKRKTVAQKKKNANLTE